VIVSELEDDVRATAESIAADAERLKQVEQAKTELPISNPALRDLAAEAEQLVEVISEKAGVQSALVDEATATS
jgi:hypothetical protein